MADPVPDVREPCETLAHAALTRAEAALRPAGARHAPAVNRHLASGAHFGEVVINHEDATA